MDLLESLQNTIIVSNYSLKQLDDNRNTLNNMETITQKTTQDLHFSKKIVNSFRSFYDRLSFKYYFNTKGTPFLVLETFNIDSNIDSNNIIDKLKQIKTNNELIGLELEQQNKHLETLSITIDKNNESLKKIDFKVTNLLS